MKEIKRIVTLSVFLFLATTMRVEAATAIEVSYMDDQETQQTVTYDSITSEDLNDIDGSDIRITLAQDVTNLCLDALTTDITFSGTGTVTNLEIGGEVDIIVEEGILVEKLAVNNASVTFEGNQIMEVLESSNDYTLELNGTNDELTNNALVNSLTEDFGAETLYLNNIDSTLSFECDMYLVETEDYIAYQTGKYFPINKNVTLVGTGDEYILLDTENENISANDGCIVILDTTNNTEVVKELTDENIIINYETREIEGNSYHFIQMTSGDNTSTELFNVSASVETVVLTGNVTVTNLEISGEVDVIIEEGILVKNIILLDANVTFEGNQIIEVLESSNNYTLELKGTSDVLTNNAVVSSLTEDFGAETLYLNNLDNTLSFAGDMYLEVVGDYYSHQDNKYFLVNKDVTLVGTGNEYVLLDVQNGYMDSENAYIVVLDTESTQINRELSFLNTKITYETREVAGVSYHFIRIDDTTGLTQSEVVHANENITSFTFTGDEQDNYIYLDFSGMTSTAMVNINGGDGNDSYSMSSINNENLSLTIDVESVRIEGVASGNLQIVIKNLEVNGAVNSFVTDYVDFNITDDFTVQMQNTLIINELLDQKLSNMLGELVNGALDWEDDTLDNIQGIDNKSLNYEILMSNGSVNVGSDFTTTINVDIETEGDAGSIYLAQFEMFLDIFFDNIDLWAQGGVKVEVGSELKTDVKTSDGLNDVSFLLLLLDSQTTIDIKNESGNKIKADSISILNSNEYDGSLVGEPDEELADGLTEAAGFLIAGYFNQDATTTVQSDLESNKSIEIINSTVHSSTLESSAALGSFDPDYNIFTMEVVFRVLENFVGEEYKDMIENVETVWTSVMKIQNAIEDFGESALGFFGITAEGQKTSSFVFNTVTINNEVNVSGNLIANEEINLTTFRDENIDIKVDASVYDGAAFLSPGGTSAYAINIVNIDQDTILSGAVEADSLILLGNGDSRLLVDVTGGYEQEQNGTGTTLTGVIYNVNNDTLLNSNTNVMGALSVKTNEEKTLSVKLDASGEETSTFGSASGFVFINNNIEAKVGSGVVSNSIYESFDVEAISTVSSTLNVVARGNGGNATAPGIAVSVLINNVDASVLNDANKVSGTMNVIGSSDATLITNVTSELLEGVAGEGTALALNVLYSDVNATVDSDVEADSFNLKGRNVVRGEFVVIASPNGEVEEGEEDDGWVDAFPDLEGMVDGVKDAITDTYDSVATAIAGFDLKESVLDLFSGEVETTESTVNKASTIGINTIIGDLNTTMNGDLTIEEDINIVNEVALNAFGFAYSNTEVPTEFGAEDGQSSSLAAITTGVIFFDSLVELNGKVLKADNVTVKTESVECEKTVIYQEEDLWKTKIETNDTNTLVFSSTSGGASTTKTTAGSINVLYLEQSYKSFIKNSVDASGDLLVYSNIKESISAMSYSSTEHDFGITISLKGKTGGTGVSLGVNFVDTTIISAIETLPTSQLSIKAKSIKVLANYLTDLTAIAEAASGGEGLGGSTKTLDAGLAVNYITPAVKAYVTGSTVSTTAGDLEIDASYSGTTNTTVIGCAEDGTKSKGGTVTFIYIVSDIQAYFNATGTIEGNATISATNDLFHEVYCEATAEGSVLGDYQEAFNIGVFSELKDLAKGNSSNTSLTGLANKIFAGSAGTTMSANLANKLNINVPSASSDGKQSNKSSQSSLTAALSFLWLNNSTKAYSSGTLSANNVEISATTNQNYHMEMHGTSQASGSAVAIVIAALLSENTTEAYAGNITSKGDVTIEASYSQNYDDQFVGGYSIEAYGSAKNGTFTLGATGGSTYAGTGVYIESNDVTKAYVTTNALINATNDVVINATEQAKFAIIAQASAKSSESDSKGAGIAFAMLNIGSNLEAFVQDGATIKANSLSITTLRPNVNDLQGDFVWSLDFDLSNVYNSETEQINTNAFDEFKEALGDMLEYFTMYNYFIVTIGSSSESNGNFAGTGSSSVILFDDINKAYIGNNVTLDIGQDVLVEAIQDISIVMAAGIWSSSGKTAAGVNVSVLLNDSQTDVTIGEGSFIEVGGNLTLKGKDEKEGYLISVLGAKASASSSDATGVALAGSVSIILAENIVNVGITGGTTVTTVTVGGNVTIDASAKLELINAMLDVVKSSSYGIGASVSTIILENKIYAKIGNNITLNATGDLSVNATSYDKVQTFMLSAAMSDDYSVGGTVSYTEIYSVISSGIGTGSIINVANLSIISDSTTIIWGILGDISYGGSGTVGGAADTITYDKTISIDVLPKSITATNNATIKINDNNSILSIVVGGGASKGFAVTGSVSTILLDSTISINVNVTEKFQVTNDILIHTFQNDVLNMYIGQISVSKNAAVGAAVGTVTNSGSSITNISSTNISGNNITITNDKDFDLTIAAVSGSVATGSASVAGVVLTVVLSSNNDTIIGTGTTISSTGNLEVGSTYDLTHDVYAGALSVSKTVAVGATVYTFVNSNEVKTTINGTALNSEGSIIIKTISTNDFALFALGIAGSGTVAVNGVVATLVLENKTYITNSANLTANNSVLVLLTNEQIVNASLGNGTASGTVAVSPSVMTVLYTGSASVTMSGNVFAEGNQTYSYEEITSNGYYLQAKNNSEFDIKAVTLGASGTVAVSACVVTLLLENSIAATYSGSFTGKNMESYVSNNVTFYTILGSLSASGTVAVSPSVLYVESESIVEQYTSGKIDVIGDVKFVTTQDSDYTGYVVGIGASGTVAVGAIVNIFMIDDEISTEVTGDVEANNVFINSINTMSNDIETAVVSVSLVAVGLVSSTIVMESSTITTAKNITAIGDVVVKTDTDEEITMYAAGIAVGGVGVGGSVIVLMFENTVKAAIENSSNIQAKSLSVNANDTFTITTLAGAISAGAVGVGASVSVLLVKNDIKANVSATSINVTNDLSVITNSIRNITAHSVSASAASTTGITASVVVLQLGDKLSTTASDYLTLNGVDQMEELQSNTDSIQSSILTSTESSAAADKFTNCFVSGDIYGEVYTNIAEDQNSAAITGGTINAGSIKVNANDQTTLIINNGAATVSGIASVGASVSVITLNNGVSANINGATITANDVEVNASAKNHEYTINLASGGVGTISLTGMVTIFDVNTNINANTTNTSVENGNITVFATYLPKGTKLADFLVGSASIGAVAVGATILYYTFNAIVNSSYSGQVINAGTINIKTDVNNSTELTVYGADIGIVSGTGVDLDITLTSLTNASFEASGSSDSIYVTNNLIQDTTIEALKASVGAITIGVFLVDYTNTGKMTAFVDGDTGLEVNGDITVHSYYNTNSSGANLGDVNITTNIVSGALAAGGGLDVQVTENYSIENKLAGIISATNNIDSHIYNHIIITVVNEGASYGVVSISATITDINVAATISNYVADYSNISANNISMQSDVYSDIYVLQKGTSAGVLAVYVSNVYVDLIPTLNAYVGESAQVDAKESFTLLNNYNVSNDKQAILSSGVEVSNNASSGALAAVQGTNTYINHSTKIYTYVNKNGVVYAGDSIEIAGSGYFYFKFSHEGETYGLVAVGTNNVEVVANATIQTSVNESAHVGSGDEDDNSDVAIGSYGIIDFSVVTKQNAGGLVQVGVNGIKVSINNTSILTTIGSAAVVSGKEVLITANLVKSYDLEVQSHTGGVIDVGTANITVESTSTNVGVNISANAEISATDTLSIYAYGYIDHISINVVASSGTLIGVSSTYLSVTEVMNVIITVASGAQIVGDKVSILSSKQICDTNIEAESVVSGLVASGDTYFVVSFTGSIETNIGDNVSISAYNDSDSQDSVEILSFGSINDIYVYNYGGAFGGAVTLSTTVSTLTVACAPKINFGNNVEIKTTGSVTINSQVNDFVIQNIAKLPKTAALLAPNGTVTAIMNVTLGATISLGSGLEIIASSNITVLTTIFNVNLVAQSYSVIFAAYSDSTATSTINLGTVDILISGTNTNLHAGEKLSIMTYVAQDFVIYANSLAEITGGVTGQVYSNSAIDVTIANNIVVTNSDLEGRDIYIYADSIRKNETTNFNQNAQSASDTIVELVTETITRFVEKVETVVNKICKWLPWPFSSLVKWVVSTIVTIVKEVVTFVSEKILGSVVEENETGSFASSSKVDLDGSTFTYGTSIGIDVVINEDGTITGLGDDESSYFDIVGNDLTLDLSQSLLGGSLQIISNVGYVTGNFVVNRNIGITNISIINNSNYNLYLGDLSLLITGSTNQEDAEYLISGYELNGNLTYTVTEYSTVTNQEDATVQIKSNKNGNLYFTGNIYLPYSTVDIDVVGNVYIEQKGQIYANSIIIQANDIGSSSNSFKIHLVGDTGVDVSLNVQATNAYLEVEIYVIDDTLTEETVVTDTINFIIEKLIIENALVLYIPSGVISTGSDRIEYVSDYIYTTQFIDILDLDGNQIIASYDEVDENGNTVTYSKPLQYTVVVVEEVITEVIIKSYSKTIGVNVLFDTMVSANTIIIDSSVEQMIFKEGASITANSATITQVGNIDSYNTSTYDMDISGHLEINAADILGRYSSNTLYINANSIGSINDRVFITVDGNIEIHSDTSMYLLTNQAMNISVLEATDVIDIVGTTIVGSNDSHYVSSEELQLDLSGDLGLISQSLNTSIETISIEASNVYMENNEHLNLAKFTISGDTILEATSISTGDNTVIYANSLEMTSVGNIDITCDVEIMDLSAYMLNITSLATGLTQATNMIADETITLDFDGNIEIENLVSNKVVGDINGYFYATSDVVSWDVDATDAIHITNDVLTNTSITNMSGEEIIFIGGNTNVTTMNSDSSIVLTATELNATTLTSASLIVDANATDIASATITGAIDLDVDNLVIGTMEAGSILIDAQDTNITTMTSDGAIVLATADLVIDTISCDSLAVVAQDTNITNATIINAVDLTTEDLVIGTMEAGSILIDAQDTNITTMTSDGAIVLATADLVIDTISCDSLAVVAQDTNITNATITNAVDLTTEDLVIGTMEAESILIDAQATNIATMTSDDSIVLTTTELNATTLTGTSLTVDANATDINSATITGAVDLDVDDLTITTMHAGSINGIAQNTVITTMISDDSINLEVLKLDVEYMQSVDIILDVTNDLTTIGDQEYSIVANSLSITSVSDVIITSDVSSLVIESSNNVSIENNKEKDLDIEEVNTTNTLDITSGNIVYSEINATDMILDVTGSIESKDNESMICANTLTIDATNNVDLSTIVSYIDITTLEDVTIDNECDLTVNTINAVNVTMNVIGSIEMSSSSLIDSDTLDIYATGPINLFVDVSYVDIESLQSLDLNNKNIEETTIGSIVAPESVTLYFEGDIIKADNLSIIQSELLLLEAKAIDISTDIATMDVQGTIISIDSIHEDIVYLEQISGIGSFEGTFVSDVVINQISVTNEGEQAVVNLSVDGNVLMKDELSLVQVEYLVVDATGDVSLQSNISFVEAYVKDEIFITNNVETDLEVISLQADKTIDIQAGNLYVCDLVTNVEDGIVSIDVSGDLTTKEGFEIITYRLEVINASNIDMTTNVSVLVLENNETAIIHNNELTDLCIENITVKDIFELTSGNVTYGLVQVDHIILFVTGNVLPSEELSVMTSKLLEATVSGSLILNGNVEEVALLVEEDLEIYNTTDLLITNIESKNTIIDVIGNVEGLVISDTLVLDVNGNVELQGDIQRLEGVVSGYLQLDNDNHLLITELESSDIYLVNSGSVTSSEFVTTNTLNYNVYGNVSLKLLVGSVEGTSTGSTTLSSPQDILINKLSGEDITVVSLGTVTIAVEILGDDVVISGASVYQLDKTTILANNLIVVAGDVMSIAGAMNANSVQLELALENDILLSSVTNNVTMYANDSATHSNVYIDGYGHNFHYQGDLSSNTLYIKVFEVSNIIITVEHIPGGSGVTLSDYALNESDGYVVVDLQDASGDLELRSIDVEKVNITTSKNIEEYYFTRDLLSIQSHDYSFNYVPGEVVEVNIVDVGGNNVVVFEDTFAKTTMDLGDGNNDVTIGVVSSKESTDSMLTTEGYLSPGNSHIVSLSSAGESKYTVLHAMEELHIYSSVENNEFVFKVFISDALEIIYNANIYITGTTNNVLSILKSNFFNRFELQNGLISGEGFNIFYDTMDDVIFDNSQMASLDFENQVYNIVSNLYRNYAVEIIVSICAIFMAIYYKKKKVSKVITKDE